MNDLELLGGIPAWAGLAVAGTLGLGGLLAGALLAGRRRSRRQRLFGGWLYLCVALGMSLALLFPRAVTTTSRRTRARLAVLVDGSRSMRETDLPSGRSRWSLVGKLVGEDSRFLAQLRKTVRVRVLRFDSDARVVRAGELDGAPEGSCTDLVRSLRSALEVPDVGPLAGLVVVTDGRVTRGSLLGLRVDEIVAAGVPCWVVGAGDPAYAARPRLAVASFEVPESAVIGETVSVEATLRARGLEGRSVDVSLLVDGKEVESRTLPTGGIAARLPLRFRIQARKQGVRRLQIAAKVRGSESVPGARSSRYMVVKGRPLRVLYAEGRLGWGYRATAAALSSAPRSSVELFPGFVRAPGEASAKTLEIASRLAAFDVVVLGDLPVSRLGRKDLAALARAVREDGLGLVFTASPGAAKSYAGTPLDPLLPVALKYEEVGAGRRKLSVLAGRNRPEVLRLDRNGPEDHRLWSSLPETACGWKPGEPRRGARTLLRAGSDPLLVAWGAGRGRVAVMAWPDHWRWARSGKSGAEAHRRFFARLALWTAGRDESGGSRLTLAMTRYRLSPGEEVSLLARLLQAPPAGVNVRVTAEIRGPRNGSGKARRLKLAPVGRNSYRLAVRGGAPGQYRIAIRASTVSGKWADGELHFSVEGSDDETEDPAPDFAALRLLARRSGGAFLGPSELDRLPGLITARLPIPKRRKRQTRRPLWDRLPVMILVLAAACGAWLLLHREAGGPREEGEQ